MADIFVSYSQKDPGPTQELVAHLTAFGYSVWFDSRLLPGEIFWQVIQDKIDEAKAVIVIWSEAALASTGVRAEALLALDKRKLISVRTAGVAATQIKLPFNALEHSIISDRIKIASALAQYGVHPMSTRGTLPDEEQKRTEAALAWEHVREISDAGLVKAFLVRYGSSHPFYRLLAERRLVELIQGGVVSLGAIPAKAAGNDEVTLVIEAGMHSGNIRRISISADGRLMATASDDKTARLWTLPEGKLVRTLRPAIGPGNAGKLHAVALSPDGRWAALGGWDVAVAYGLNMYLSILDTVTGLIIARLGPLQGVTFKLEFSCDGLRLATGGEYGIKVWDTTSWKLFYDDVEYDGMVFGLSFADDGRLATTSIDGRLRLYSNDGRLVCMTSAPDGERPLGIKFSPDNSMLAVGYNDSTCVSVLSASTLELIYNPDTIGIDNGGLGAVAWLGDGVDLIAAGSFYRPEGDSAILKWSGGSGGERHALTGPDNTVMDLAKWHSGFAVSAANASVSLANTDGTILFSRSFPGANFNSNFNEQLWASQDGTRVRLSLSVTRRDFVLYDHMCFDLTVSDVSLGDLIRADTEGLGIKSWRNSMRPTLEGRPLKMKPHEYSRCIAISPDQQKFVLGAEWSLRCFDSRGEPLWERSTPDTACSVNLTREGRLLIVAYGDGTIRWHRSSDGSELLALYVHMPEVGAPKRWVAWTPTSHYNCSQGADSLIGWHINRGVDRLADFFPVETFAATFKRPDLLAKIFDGI